MPRGQGVGAEGEVDGSRLRTPVSSARGKWIHGEADQQEKTKEAAATPSIRRCRQTWGQGRGQKRGEALALMGAAWTEVGPKKRKCLI